LHLRILNGGLRRLHKRAFAWIDPGVAAIPRFAIAKVIAMSDPRTTDYRAARARVAKTQPVVLSCPARLRKFPGAILEVTALIRSEAIKTGVTVGTQLAGELPRIQGDRVQLQQVMLN
jgi:hypothetical protein